MTEIQSAKQLNVDNHSGAESIEQPLRRSARRLPMKKPAAVATQPIPKKGKRQQSEVAVVLEESDEVVGDVSVSPLAPPSVEPPSLDVIEEPRDRSLAGITGEAKKLRELNPAKYGVKGAREGMPGYVKGGWKLALADAATALGCKSKAAAKTKRAEKVSLNRKQKEAKQAYLEELRLLQVKYFPLIGRKVSAKATKQAARKAEEEEGADKV